MSTDRFSLKIHHLAEEDRPREKLMLQGRSSLTDAELIAILLGSGNKDRNAVELAQTILYSVSNNLHSLAKLTVPDLTKFNGIGEAKAITIVSALELGRRRKEQEPLKKVKIASSEDIFQLLHSDLMDLPHEEFWLVSLNRANHVIKKERLSFGGTSGTVVDPKIIFRRALENKASGIIVAHNHPSGNLKASQQDINITAKIRKAGVFMEIPLIDHLIFSDEAYYSFADHGEL